MFIRFVIANQDEDSRPEAGPRGLLNLLLA